MDEQLQSICRTLITASHVLHYHGLVDAYGHVSARHPYDPSLFLMSRYIAPAIISSPTDIVIYQVQDSEPVNSNAPKGYSERHIHGECYKLHHHVHSVVHSHSLAVIPFGITKVPMLPCFHLASFLGPRVPIFDITEHYGPHDVRDMLVRNSRLGNALARSFSSENIECPLVLMRGHGMTVVGSSIRESTVRAIYVQQNAKVQSAAVSLSSNYFGRNPEADDIKYLDEAEMVGALKKPHLNSEKPWGLWKREVEASNLYVNLA